jgi:excisionase family DNA binding protein
METNKQRPKPELITIDDAANILNVSRRTVSRLCSEGKISAVRIGFQWRIHRRALLKSVGLQDLDEDDRFRR